MFGDNWSDELDANDIKTIENYFLKIESLKKYWGTISFKVGSKEINIKMSNKHSQILFEAPRKSLMMSINKEIFDDMLIGNFMKTTIINKSLYIQIFHHMSQNILIMVKPVQLKKLKNTLIIIKSTLRIIGAICFYSKQSR